MNNDEKIANKYLCSLGNIVFEPDGNIAPDFLLNNRTAIEVRRLNQNFIGVDKTNGLEELSIPFIRQIDNELAKYPYIHGGSSYFLRLKYRRPIGSLKNIKKRLKESLKDFELNGEVYPKCYSLSENVEIEIGAEARNIATKYNIGILRDWDSGGWLVNMYSTEINYCIKEKSQKISSHLSRYSEWWLILVDRIGGIDSESKKEVLSYITSAKEFKKVIVLNYESKVVITI